MSKRSKEIKELVTAAKNQGWRVERTDDGYRFLAPDGKGIVHAHLTEGDHRAMRNTISRMRQHGFEWRER